MEIREKSWGKEILCINEPEYVLKILKINKLASISKHHHSVKTESLYLFQGEANVRVYNCKSGKNYQIKELGTITIKPGTVHQITGVTDCIIIEVSTQPEDDIRRD